MKLKHVWFLIVPLIVLAAMLAWRQTAVRADAALATQPPPDETLLEMAQSSGMVPVIVGLQLPTYAPQAADEAAQMAAIDRAQTAVLDSLAGHNIQNVKQFPYIPYMALWVDEAALLALYEMKGVTAVYEDQVSAPHTSSSSLIIRSDSANSLGYRGQGQTVAVLDTGVQRLHADLSGKVVSEACYSTTSAGSGSTSLCPNGSSSQTGTGAANPPANFVAGYDHGTHVAGIVAGVAPQATIIAIQVFSRYSDVAGAPPSSLTPCANSGRPSPCTFSYASDQILGLQRVYALRNSYNIAAVNMSLGGGSYTSNCDNLNAALTTTILSLRSAGIPTVISAGNNGYRGSIGSPACISYAVSVGATTSTPGPMTPNLVGSYSNVATIMTMFAPGGSIQAAVPTWATNCGPGIAPISNRCYKQGTSMAAPHVAGGLAVMRSAAPSATVNQMISAFTSTGPIITDGRPGGFVSKRRLDVYAATCQLVGCDQDDFRTMVLGQNLVGTVGVGSDYTDVYYVNGTAGQRLRLSMTRSSGTLDPFLVLVDPYGSLVALNNDGGVGNNALIDPVILPFSGRYTIYANSAGGSGAYQITVGTGTYAANPIPTILSMSRTSATINSPAGFWVGITGNNFMPNSVVRWNGNNRPTTFHSPTFVWGWVQPSDTSALGTNSMTVYNPMPGGGTSFAQGFQITGEPLGVSEMLAPLPDSSVPVGVQETFAISWTHPISSWRVMQNIDIRLKDVSDQTAFWIRFTEGSPTSTIALLNTSGDMIASRPLVSGQPGQPETLEVPDLVTMHMAETLFFGSGRTVIISPTVSFGDLAPGRYMVEFTVNNDEGEVQDADVVGAFYVLPPGCDTALTAVQVNGPDTGAVNTNYQFTATITPTALSGVSYVWQPEPVSGQGTAAATFNWSQAGMQPVNVVAQHCSGFLADVATVGIRTTSAPDLEISKVAPATAVGATDVAGDPITYTLTITNHGGTDATGLAISDTLPPGATYVSGGSYNGSQVSWTIPTLPGYGFASQVTAVVTANDTISNSVYGVTAAGGYSAVGQETAVTRLVDAQVRLTPLLTETLHYAGSQSTDITVPYGAVFADTVLAYEELAAPGHPLPAGYAGRAFRLSGYQENRMMAELVLAETAVVTVTYAQADVAGLDENLLAVQYWDGGGWSWAGVTCTRDVQANWVSCRVPDAPLTKYALAETQSTVYLPMIINGTPPPALSATITGITLVGSQYAAAFQTTGFTPDIMHTHVHFFFNTVPPEQAGVPGAGPWYVYGGGSPFSGYGLADRPIGATQLCVLVANHDHSVIQGTGNCVALP
jgi:subtilisin